jgi:hypothetical protein
MATTYLTRTLGTPTDNNKWTFSCWLKYTRYSGTYPNSEAPFFHADAGSTTSWSFIGLDEANQLILQNRISSANVGYIISNAKLQDAGAWYNVVAVFDGSNSTAADRQILYLNGERITSFAGETQAPLDTASNINSAIEHRIGRGHGHYGSKYFGGSMSHVHFIDGTAYPATAFGSVDSTSGIWTINTAPSVTYGNNGFSILKDGISLTDSSPNSNNFSLGGGTLTKTEDCPDNNFTTMNPLDNYYAAGTFSNGNNTVVTSNGNYARNSSTIGMSTGKWYSEYKVGSITGSGGIYIGITGDLATGTGGNTGNSPFSYAYASNGTKHFNGSSSSFGNSYTTGDIIGVALDATNSKIWWSKNGVWQASGDPSNGSNPAYTVIVPSSTTIGAYFWSFSDNNSGEYFTCDCNFGNGYFGTTPVSSAGTNASSNGIFEYDVPTGYTALSTKGLNL